MSWFTLGKTCVFSEVKVTLMMNGETLANAKVTRQWEWNKRVVETAYTDERGAVYFPAKFERSLARLLPLELVIGQQLSVEFEGNEIEFWSNSKREAGENTEFGGKPFDALCELSDEARLVKDYGSLMVTKCRLLD